MLIQMVLLCLDTSKVRLGTKINHYLQNFATILTILLNVAGIGGMMKAIIVVFFLFAIMGCAPSPNKDGFDPALERALGHFFVAVYSDDHVRMLEWIPAHERKEMINESGYMQDDYLRVLRAMSLASMSRDGLKLRWGKIHGLAKLVRSNTGFQWQGESVRELFRWEDVTPPVEYYDE
jgi:hypothetical protein